MESSYPSLWRIAFSSLIRSFGAVLGFFFGVCVLLIVALLAFSSVGSDRPELSTPKLKAYYQPNAHNQLESFFSHDTPFLLEIPIRGTIGMGGTDLSYMREVVRRVLDPKFHSAPLKGIFLNINSPGGTLEDTIGIVHMISELKNQCKIPVVAFVSGTCASGSYWCACAADTILATPASMVGSVGVIMGPFFNVLEGFEKLGIQSTTLTQGAGKDTGSPFKKWTPDEFSSLDAITQEGYQLFLDAVLKARPLLTLEILKEKIGAHIVTGIQAKHLGLVDANVWTREEALQELVSRSELESYQVISLVKEETLFSEITEMHSLHNLLGNFIQKSIQGIGQNSARLLALCPALADFR